MSKTVITGGNTFHSDNSLPGFLHLYFFRDAAYTNEIGKLILYDNNQLITNICTIKVHNEGHFNGNNYPVSYLGDVDVYMEGKIQPSISNQDITTTVIQSPSISELWQSDGTKSLSSVGNNQYYHLCFYQAKSAHSTYDGHLYYLADYDRFYSKVIVLNTNFTTINVESINFYNQ